MEVRYVTDRHDTLCAKYRQDYRDNPDYLYCGVADMDLAPPEPVLEAMKRRLDHYRQYTRLSCADRGSRKMGPESEGKSPDS